jgi:hypothetical protein
MIALGERFALRPGVDVAGFARDLELMAELGTRRVAAAILDAGRARTLDYYARLTEMADAECGRRRQGHHSLPGDRNPV